MALFWIFVSLFSWLRDAFRSSSIKHLFANCRKDPFFIRTWVGNHRKHYWKTIKISWNLFQNRSKIVQGTFWWPSGAPWGAQGVPDWILGVKSWFVGPPLDPQMGSIFRFFSMQNSCDFLLVFWMHFGRIWHPFWRPNASKIGSEMENVCFLFWASRVRESLIWEVWGVRNR